MDSVTDSNQIQFSLHPLEGKTEPRLWFKRLKIWSEPGKVIRTIDFQLGLNIIWSHRDGKAGDTGLNPGNTSVARLLRYCLGEDHFGTKVHEQRVSGAFPNGAVGAEIRLEGADWAVLRSLSDSGKCVAGCGQTFEGAWAEFRASNEKSFEVFRTKISEAFNPDLQAFIDNPSETALGFASRDHAGGFNNVFRWRAAHNNSGHYEREDLRVWALCALLGFRASKESGPRKNSKSKTLQPLPDDLLAGLAEKLGIEVEAKRNITELLKQAEKNDASANRALKESEERLRELVELEKTEAQLLLFKNQLQLAKNARDMKSKLKLRKNVRCRLTKKPLPTLLKDEGCLLRKVGCNLDDLECELNSIKEEIRSLEDHIQNKENLVADLGKKVGERNQHDLKTRVGDCENRVKICHSTVLEAHGAKETLKNLNEAFGERTSSDTEQAAEGDSSEDEQKPLLQVQQSDRNFAEFIKTFQLVVLQLISPAAAAAINKNTNSIRDLFQGESEDRGSNTNLMNLWAFDLAALVRSIEAPVFLPGHLIHDSPRQEDLPDEQYWRLFRLAHILEQKCDVQPLFQYIITTSTPPPPELRGTDHVKVHLAPGKKVKFNPATGREEDDGLLFRCRF